MQCALLYEVSTVGVYLDANQHLDCPALVAIGQHLGGLPSQAFDHLFHHSAKKHQWFMTTFIAHGQVAIISM